MAAGHAGRLPSEHDWPKAGISRQGWPVQVDETGHTTNAKRLRSAEHRGRSTPHPQRPALQEPCCSARPRTDDLLRLSCHARDEIDWSRGCSNAATKGPETGPIHGNHRSSQERVTFKISAGALHALAALFHHHIKQGIEGRPSGRPDLPSSSTFASKCASRWVRKTPACRLNCV